MSLTAVDIDDTVLGQARTILGTKTKRDTINAALYEVVRRRAAVELVGLLKRDLTEIRDHRELRRLMIGSLRQLCGWRRKHGAGVHRLVAPLTWSRH
jgi:Arc/MetJ family transcription regulator